MYATRSNVEAAIQALQAKGERITTRSVREAIGGGSLEDIARLISEVLMDEPTADDAPALPSLPYDLPPLDETAIQHHLAQMEGEAQALALMDHLQALINAARAVPTAAGGIDWLFRRVQAMGQIGMLSMSIHSLAKDLERVSGTAAAMLARMRREYQRVKGHDHEEGQDDGGAATSAREPVEAGDAESHGGVEHAEGLRPRLPQRGLSGQWGASA
jgi:Plasmid replication region DNA-binding N-term